MIEDDLRAYDFVEKKEQVHHPTDWNIGERKSTYENEIKSIEWWHIFNNLNFTYSACNLIVYELK